MTDEEKDQEAKNLQRAKEAFDAYNKKAGGLTWDKKPIPPWEETGEKVQANWMAATFRARQGMYDEMYEWLESLECENETEKKMKKQILKMLTDQVSKK